ncbi:LemA family protein [Sphingomonas sp. G-3-2-10]|uniref:LemA family protein n=1 Tax=Sphingomonas sp. G-3-2-10 TaxID=2728838 RepID=UPI00146DE87E|nr:LemA family protein [Sphingomonas sp. G-3-2-10]NML07720.1 LemA family protein [Sphingomonas sp. G-3-2-10]
MKLRAAFVLMSALLLSACGINSVPKAEEGAKARWADVQNAYQRRADLIPNIAATVKAAAGSEGKILTDVTNARARATSVQLAPGDLTDPAKVEAFRAAQDQLSGALGRLLVSVEAYPQLKSQDGWTMLIRELAGSENRISVSITDYNKAVEAYNVRVRTFPDAIGARIFYGAKPIVPYQSRAGAELPSNLEVILGNAN